MKILKIKEDFLSVIEIDRPIPASNIDTKGYGNLGFECGCGEWHAVNDPNILQVATFFPVKILFKCGTHFTKVHIKGIFSQSCISEWACENSLFEKWFAEFIK
jgi:hypothetical protein